MNAFLTGVPFTCDRLPADGIEAASTDAFKRKVDARTYSKGAIVTKNPTLWREVPC